MIYQARAIQGHLYTHYILFLIWAEIQVLGHLVRAPINQNTDQLITMGMFRVGKRDPVLNLLFGNSLYKAGQIPVFAICPSRRS